MSEKQDEPTQKTKPKQGKPVDIPVPTEAQISRDFEKIATAAHRDEDDETSE